MKPVCRIAVVVGLIMAMAGVAMAEPTMVLDGEPQNPFASGEVEPTYPDQELHVGPDQEVATEQAAVQAQEDARKMLFRRSIAKTSRKPGTSIDLFDAKTGAPLDAEDAIDAMAKDDTLITEDEFGPIGPGRRERIAQMVGLTAEQAKALWPWDEPEPVKASDVVRARKLFGNGDPESMSGALARLMPKQGKERAEQLKRTVLSAGEVSFACYAAMGFPFPIRVGKIGGKDHPVPPNGYVIFNPQLFRADLTRTDFQTRHITYRWMDGKNEVYSAQADVETYLHMPRPSAPVTHLLVSSDDDVMAYQIMGIQVPGGIWDVRKVLMNDLVDLYSYLRPTVTLYGLRWSLLPGIDEIQDQPQTRMRMAEILDDLGLLNREKSANLRAIKADAEYQGGFR